MGESDATSFGKSVSSASHHKNPHDLCGQCGKKQHRDKILLDQCRLFTALLGPRWGYTGNSPRVGKQERSFQVWDL